MPDTATSTTMSLLILDHFWLWIAATSLLATLCALILYCWHKDLDSEDRHRTSLIFALALAVLWPSARHAMNMQVSPDSVEYGVAAFKLWTSGAYQIEVHGQTYPPRYPFGFAAFVLLPFFGFVSNPHAGVGIFGVTLLTALGAPSAYVLGRRMHSASVGLLASAAYLLLPGLALSAQELLTQAPTAGLWLLIGALFVARPVEPLAYRSAFAVGLAGFLAAACRPLAGVLIASLLPFVLARRERIGTFCILVGPTAALAISYLFYNNHVFGNALRSGYHYWCSIPYDFFLLTFHHRYLGANLFALWNSGCIGLLILAGLGVRSPPQSDSARRFQKAAHLATLITVVVHLLYFYQSELFFLPTAALMTVPAAIGVVELGKRAGLQLKAIQAAVALCLGAVVVRAALVQPAQSKNERINFVEMQLAPLPSGSILITGLNPAFLESLIPQERNIEIVPISRRVEYADKVVVRRKPSLLSTPASPTDHRSSSLPLGNFEEVYSTVALEDLLNLEQALKAGKAIYLDVRFTPMADRHQLIRRFNAASVSPGLVRLGLSNPLSAAQ